MTKRNAFTKFIPLVQSINQDGYGFSLSEIRYMCEEESLELSNKLIKQYLADELGE